MLGASLGANTSTVVTAPGRVMFAQGDPGGTDGGGERVMFAQGDAVNTGPDRSGVMFAQGDAGGRTRGHSRTQAPRPTQ